MEAVLKQHTRQQESLLLSGDYIILVKSRKMFT